MLTKKVPLLLLVFVLFVSATPAQQTAGEVPADYESDGCSIFPDGNYRDCCVAHDKDYYVGGSCSDRSASDKRLYQCVKSKKGWKSKVAAPIMWLGVRVFGVSFLPTPFRWGFGKDKKKSKAKSKPESAEHKKPVEDEKTPEPFAAPTPDSDPAVPVKQKVSETEPVKKINEQPL